MDQPSHMWLRWELRQHMDALLMVLDDLVRRTEGLPPVLHTTLQGGVVAVQAQLQAFDELFKSTLLEAGVDTDAQDALARLLEQVQARKQDVEDQMQRLRDAPTEDWESRLAMLEAVWHQLDKASHVAMREFTPRPRPDKSQ